MKTFFLSCLALSGLMLSQAEPEPEQDRSLKIKSCTTFSFLLTSDDTNCVATKEDYNEVSRFIKFEFEDFEIKMGGDLRLDSIELNGANTRGLGRRKLNGCTVCGGGWPKSDRLRHLSSNGLRHRKADTQRQLADGIAKVLSDPEFQSTVNTDVFKSTKFCATGIEFN